MKPAVRLRPGALFLSALLLTSCGGLPHALRNQIVAERQSIEQAKKQIQRSLDTVKADIAHAPDLFQNAPVAQQWPAKLDSARATLDRSESELDNIGKLTPERAEERLSEARSLRQSALRDAQSIQADADNWLDFRNNQPHYLAAMQREYDRIHAVDLTPVSMVVDKAEHDWPAKKSALDQRFSALQQSQKDADTQWTATAAARADSTAGKATGAEVATLIEANDALTHDENQLTHGADDLRAACGQLYNSWDKILADLEVSHRGGDAVYAEKINTIRTHYTDVAAKTTEVSNETRWVDVPAPQYRAVENDLGMVIAHKDAGLFDSEAQTTAQPPGFAYMAPPSVGSNQYGYWSHQGGQSVWTWLPEYLILRDLLWGHSYRPVYVTEFYGYQNAVRAGRSWYGQETPSAAPRYGSHGTFTQQRYASSRYVQSGGYSGSGYASNRSSGSTVSRPDSGFEPRSAPRSAPEDNPGVGKRFGGSGSGQRFGSGNASGQRFGAPRSAPRSSGGMRFGGSRRR